MVKKKISIIISNRNDVIMLNVTVRSALEALKAIDNDGEIVIVDNSRADHYELVRSVIPQGYIRQKRIKLVRQEFPCFTEARHEAARNASGEYLFCVDSHCLFGHNVLRDSVDFMDSHVGDNIGFGHPPINWAGQHERHGKHDLRITEHPWGAWKARYDEPRRISWKFMPWICRRDWYLPILRGYGSLADNRLAWGGAELHQQNKAWMLGYENWAIPTDPVIHLGPFSTVANSGLTGYKYRVYGSSGVGPAGLGILVAFYVWCGDEGIEIGRIVQERLHKRHGLDVENMWPKAREYGQTEHEWFREAQVMSYNEMMTRRPWECN
jgi:glycosyltransferase involved in cell wall biosynthesis